MKMYNCLSYAIRKGDINMDFFNDIGKKFSSVARQVSEKTKESVESTRLYGDIRSSQNDLEQLYAEYGKACYDIRMGSGNEELAKNLEGSIQAMIKRIEDLNAQRDELRAVRRCPGCGSVQSKEARFCANCGKRMPEDAPKPEAEEKTEEAEFCTECGAMREPEKRFCTVCGKDFSPEDAGEQPAAPAAEPVEMADAEEPDAAADSHQE